MATAFFLSLKPPSFPSTTTRHHPIRPSSADPKAHNHRFPPQISFSSFRNNSGIPSETECPVPLDQQPINEYQALSNSFPFSWASGSLVEYCARLFVTGASFALLVGLPVSWFGSVGPKSEPLRLVFGAASSGFFVVTLAVVRMYLGWAYVGNRLLSATVECNLALFSIFWVVLL